MDISASKSFRSVQIKVGIPLLAGRTHHRWTLTSLTGTELDSVTFPTGNTCLIMTYYADNDYTL